MSYKIITEDKTINFSSDASINNQIYIGFQKDENIASDNDSNINSISINEDKSWIAITPLNVTNHVLPISINIAANTESTERTGDITLTFNSISSPHKIIIKLAGAEIHNSYFVKVDDELYSNNGTGFGILLCNGQKYISQNNPDPTLNVYTYNLIQFSILPLVSGLSTGTYINEGSEHAYSIDASTNYKIISNNESTTNFLNFTATTRSFANIYVTSDNFLTSGDHTFLSIVKINTANNYIRITPYEYGNALLYEDTEENTLISSNDYKYGLNSNYGFSGDSSIYIMPNKLKYIKLLSSIENINNVYKYINLYISGTTYNNYFKDKNCYVLYGIGNIENNAVTNFKLIIFSGTSNETINNNQYICIPLEIAKITKFGSTGPTISYNDESNITGNIIDYNDVSEYIANTANGSVQGTTVPSSITNYCSKNITNASGTFINLMVVGTSGSTGGNKYIKQIQDILGNGNANNLICNNGKTLYKDIQILDNSLPSTTPGGVDALTLFGGNTNAHKFQQTSSSQFLRKKVTTYYGNIINLSAVNNN